MPTDYKTQLRGIRNNNPGNIRRSKDKWEGLAPEQNDREFLTFQSPLYGIRAMARILVNYQDTHKCRTIQRIISRWAPAQENKTLEYIQCVAQRTKFEPNEMLDMRRPSHLKAIIMAIIYHENGAQPYPEETIEEGISLALAPA